MQKRAVQPNDFDIRKNPHCRRIKPTYRERLAFYKSPACNNALYLKYFIVLFFIISSASSLRAEDNEAMAANEDRREEIAKELAEASKDKNLARRPRAVKASELTESRGYEEDKLRMYLLANYTHQDPSAIRDILNSPWDANAVAQLWEKDRSSEAIRLIVFVSDKHKDTFNEVRDSMGELYCYISKLDDEQINYFYLSGIRQALEDYGSEELLTNSFWDMMERDYVGFYFLPVIRKFGGNNVYNELVELNKYNHWTDEDDLIKLHDLINTLKKDLNITSVADSTEQAIPSSSPGTKSVALDNICLINKQENKVEQGSGTFDSTEAKPVEAISDADSPDGYITINKLYSGNNLRDSNESQSIIFYIALSLGAIVVLIIVIILYKNISLR